MILAATYEPDAYIVMQVAMRQGAQKDSYSYKPASSMRYLLIQDARVLSCCCRSLSRNVFHFTA